MPPYDPKANRPKLVPVEGDQAPVDALLGPAPAEPEPGTATDAPAVARAHLSVVAPDDRAPRPAPEPAPLDAVPSSRLDAKTIVAVAVTVAAVLGLIVVARRRG